MKLSSILVTIFLSVVAFGQFVGMPPGVRSGTFASIPATCGIGDWYWANNATPGLNLYFCTALNTWTAAGVAGGGVTSLAATSPFAVSGSTGAVTGSLNVGVDFAFTAQQSFKSLGTTPSVANMATVVKDSAGTPILYIGPFAAGRFGIWPGGVTPSSTNYMLQGLADGTSTAIGSSTNLLFISNGAITGTISPSQWKVGVSDTLIISQSTGKMTTYGAIATVSNGIPSELATIDLTAQTAAKGSTTLYTPTSTGWYRVQYVAKVTTAASVSSILGGTTGFTLSYQDGTDSVAVTMTCPEFNEAGANLAIGTGNTGNATTSMVQGSCQIYAKTGVAINYTFGYSSTNAAEMVYHLRGKLEAM